MINMVKLPTSKSELFLRVAKGHFATSHSHINYYIDVTTQKSRLSEAKAVAKELVSAYQHSTIVDTVLCLDGTQVIGTCLANELTKDGFTNMNAHKTIYIVTPEYTSGSQIILRDNLAPMVKGKHVLILAASITTGYTIQAAVEAVNYYGGIVAGLSAIFATTHECLGYPVTSIFDPTSLPDYASFDSRDCPLCKAGQHIDALVNNAGIAQQKLLTDITDDDWRRMLDVNLSGAFYVTRTVLPGMISRKRGSIVNVSSIWGQVGASCEAHYSAAKAGLIGLTRALAKEVGPSGVTVNCVCPGVIQTDMLGGFTPGDLKALAEETPLGRLGTPQEVAAAILWLCREEAAFVTGQVIGVGGGFGE